jgi:hypothetical protein
MTSDVATLNDLPALIDIAILQDDAVQQFFTASGDEGNFLASLLKKSM